MSPSTLVSDAVTHARRSAVLAVVPFVVGVARWHDLVTVGADTTTQFSVTFPTPHSFVTLWSFLNVPTADGAGIAGGSGPLPGLVASVAFVLVTRELTGVDGSAAPTTESLHS